MAANAKIVTNKIDLFILALFRTINKYKEAWTKNNQISLRVSAGADNPKILAGKHADKRNPPIYPPNA
jgi:hypothetical protein